MVIEVKNSGVVRVFSTMNTWMDCVFIVSKEETEHAIEVLEKAWNEFWDDESDITYGEKLEAAMYEAGIEYEVFYNTDEEE